MPYYYQVITGLIIIALGTHLGLQLTHIQNLVVSLLLAVTFSLLSAQKIEWIKRLAFIAFIVSSFMFPTIALFLPFFVLFCGAPKLKQIALLLVIIPLIQQYQNATLVFLLALITLFAWTMKLTLASLQKFKALYFNQLDDASESRRSFLQREYEQTKSADLNLQIKLLEERGRIASELHDHIGHTISSSIVQAETYKILYLDSEKKLDEKLTAINRMIATLKDGMLDIRTSLYHLKDTSLDLKTELSTMQQRMPNIKLTYFIVGDDMSYQMKTDVMRIITEAITNTSKHSDATAIKINLMEQVSFYSLTIKDNGSVEPKDLNFGMGLSNIQHMAKSYDGTLNYGYDHGFYIHVILK